VVRFQHCPLFFRGKWSDIQRIGEWVEPSAVFLSDFNERQGLSKAEVWFRSVEFWNVLRMSYAVFQLLYFVTEFRLSAEPLENVAAVKSRANPLSTQQREVGGGGAHSLYS
jgi:hypothetical protein